MDCSHQKLSRSTFFKNVTSTFCFKRAWPSPSEITQVIYHSFHFESFFIVLPSFYIPISIKILSILRVAYFSWISICIKIRNLPTHSQHYLCIYFSSTNTQRYLWLSGPVHTKHTKSHISSLPETNSLYLLLPQRSYFIFWRLTRFMDILWLRCHVGNLW